MSNFAAIDWSAEEEKAFVAHVSNNRISFPCKNNTDIVTKFKSSDFEQVSNPTFIKRYRLAAAEHSKWYYFITCIINRSFTKLKYQQL